MNEVLRDTWDSIPAELQERLLTTLDAHQLDEVAQGVAAAAVLAENATTGEVAWPLLPGDRQWRRPEQEQEPPPRSHLSAVADVLDFIGLYIGPTGSLELRLEELGDG